MAHLSREQLAVIRAASKVSHALAEQLTHNPHLLSTVMKRVAGNRDACAGLEQSQRTLVEDFVEKAKKQGLVDQAAQPKAMHQPEEHKGHHKTPFNMTLRPPGSGH